MASTLDSTVSKMGRVSKSIKSIKIEIKNICYHQFFFLIFSVRGRRRDARAIQPERRNDGPRNRAQMAGKGNSAAAG